MTQEIKAFESSLSPEEATEINLRIKQRMAEMTINAFELGHDFAYMRDTRGWFALGEQNFDSWIASLGFKRRTVYNFMKLDELWEKKLKFVIAEHQGILLNTHYSKILMLQKEILQAETTDDVANLIHQAFTLSRSDIAEEKRDKETPSLKGTAIISKYHGNVITLEEVDHNFKPASNQAVFGVYGKKKIKFTFTVVRDERD